MPTYCKGHVWRQATLVALSDSVNFSVTSWLARRNERLQLCQCDNEHRNGMETLWSSCETASLRTRGTIRRWLGSTIRRNNERTRALSEKSYKKYFDISTHSKYKRSVDDCILVENITKLCWPSGRKTVKKKNGNNHLEVTYKTAGYHAH